MNRCDAHVVRLWLGALPLGQSLPYVSVRLRRALAACQHGRLAAQGYHVAAIRAVQAYAGEYEQGEDEVTLNGKCTSAIPRPDAMQRPMLLRGCAASLDASNVTGAQFWVQQIFLSLQLSEVHQRVVQARRLAAHNISAQQQRCADLGIDNELVLRPTWRKTLVADLGK